MSNWYMALPKIQAQNCYTDKVRCSTHILKYFGNKPVNQVDADQMDKFREMRREAGAAHGTIDNEIKFLRAVYKLAVKRKKIPVDALPGEFYLVKEVNPRRIISNDEFESILKHTIDPEFQDFLICAYESAMRVNEIIKLTPAQVHLNIQHISGNMVDYVDLGIFDTKNRTRRTVPVSSRLKEVLRRRIEGLDSEDRVFTTGGKIYYRLLVRAKIKAACKRAGIIYGDKQLNKKGERIGIVFHCLRHTRTTKWVVMGFSDEIIRRATGHKSLESYQRYVKLDPHVVMRLVEGEKSKADNSGTKSASSL
jgi:integrase